MIRELICAVVCIRFRCSFFACHWNIKMIWTVWHRLALRVYIPNQRTRFYCFDMCIIFSNVELNTAHGRTFCEETKVCSKRHKTRPILDDLPSRVFTSPSGGHKQWTSNLSAIRFDCLQNCRPVKRKRMKIQTSGKPAHGKENQQAIFGRQFCTTVVDHAPVEWRWFQAGEWGRKTFQESASPVCCWCCCFFLEACARILYCFDRGRVFEVPRNRIVSRSPLDWVHARCVFSSRVADEPC